MIEHKLDSHCLSLFYHWTLILGDGNKLQNCEKKESNRFTLVVESGSRPTVLPPVNIIIAVWPDDVAGVVDDEFSSPEPPPSFLSKLDDCNNCDGDDDDALTLDERCSCTDAKLFIFHNWMKKSQFFLNEK